MNMEAVESVVLSEPVKNGKDSVIEGDTTVNKVQEHHDTNGISETSEHYGSSTEIAVDPNVHIETTATEMEIGTVSTEKVSDCPVVAPSELIVSSVVFDSENVPKEDMVVSSDASQVENVVEQIPVPSTEIITENIDDIASEIVNTQNVQFETQVVIEQDETIISSNSKDLDKNIKNNYDDTDAANKILCQLEGQSIDLSEALLSTTDGDGNDNVCYMKQTEVLNKEELLDILEGNDSQPVNESENKDYIEFNNMTADLEKELALHQLQKLQKKSPRRRVSDKHSNNVKQKTREQQTTKKPSKQSSKKESIVNVLVKDWDDDDANEKGSSTQSNESSVINTSSVCNTDNLEKEVEKAMEEINENNESQISNKSLDESCPSRRVSRVIKKKIIFDPDNPDTFTKSKAFIKKEIVVDKDQPPLKKGKSEVQALITKPKSPTGKTQWKKPQPKNSKQNKRLTEVDKLLMDEGAVNMIYQVAPEAPRGRKNMRTKAEFIKKINQSSTPDAKEMKFRERRKEVLKDELEPRKILSNKQRTSLNSSVKSPSVSEDYEVTSADDSIIYRRHSSSSYSSTCMSPRRLSDVDANSYQNLARISQQNAESQIEVQIVDEVDHTVEVKETDIFMQDDSSNVATDEVKTINKNDCLTIKEKLNSKLSHLLNIKRKGDIKLEKPTKQKKTMSKPALAPLVPQFHQLTVTFSDQIAEICIGKTGSTNNEYNIETLKEFRSALEFIDSKMNIPLTLITSEKGVICSGLDLRPLLKSSNEHRYNYASELIENLGLLLQSLEQHSKVLATGVNGRCEGLELTVVALCDIAMATDTTTFALSSRKGASLIPGFAALVAYSRLLPQSLVNEMTLLGRELSAREALQYGLVSRTLWPEHFLRQLKAMARDMAAGESVQTLLMKKRLLKLRNSVGNELSFMSCLETERDAFVEYWTSAAGEEALCAHFTSA